MHNFIIIQDMVIILAVAMPIIFLFKKIHIPPIVGYLIAGMIIGPYGFALIEGLDEIEVMAEIGVILLLFTIGLEVSFKKLLKIKKYLILVGGSQVVLTIILSAAIFYVSGIGINQSIYFGMLLSLSSTAIVLKLLSERNELESPQGKITLGILLFQDLAIVPIFLMIPILDPLSETGAGEIFTKLAIAFGILAIVLVLAKYLMPKITYHLARLKQRDAFTVGVILLLLGTAYITHSLGLSFALGAFIAGLILAESEYSTQIVADILPLRDVFNSIFFVSVGLLLNISFVIDFPFMIIAATIAVLLFKAIIIFLIVMAIKYPVRIALITGLGLAQVGEFSFVLAQAGSEFNLLSPEYYNVFLASSIFTMILTPFLIKYSPLVAFKSGEYIKTSNEIEGSKKKITDHVIIVGFGVNGRNLAKVLKETGIKYVVLELNPDTVKKEKARNENIFYGDVSKEEVLHHIGVESAKVIVFTLADPLVTRRALQIVKRMNTNIYVVVRTRFVAEIDELQKLGADEVIPEEFETSLQIFRKVLQRYHIPLNIIMQQTALLRDQCYKLMRKEESPQNVLTHIDEILAQGLTETFYITEDNLFVGHTLQELNLRAKTGATIIAIVRENKAITNPASSEKFMFGDTLVISGFHEAVDKAIRLLEVGEIH